VACKILFSLSLFKIPYIHVTISSLSQFSVTANPSQIWFITWCLFTCSYSQWAPNSSTPGSWCLITSFTIRERERERERDMYPVSFPLFSSTQYYIFYVGTLIMFIMLMWEVQLPHWNTSSLQNSLS